MSRPVRHGDLAGTMGKAEDCELLEETFRAITSVESKIEDAVAELHRLAIVARELALRLNCAPMSHMESLTVLDSVGDPAGPDA